MSTETSYESRKQLMWGLALIAFGVAILLDRLDMFEINDIWHYWPLLLVIAIIPLSEALSVVIQVAYFKLTRGKRFFKMTPIHLHFELLGWSETQVVQRFWLIGLLAAMVGIGLAIV